MINIELFQDPVLFFNNAIGDHLINLPAIRALSHIFEGRLTLILEKGYYELFYSDIKINSLIEIDIQWIDHKRRFDVKSVSAKINSCDIFICINPWFNSDVELLIKYLSPKSSIGFFDSYTCKLPLDHNKHSAELAFDVVKYFVPAIQISDFSAPPSLPATAKANALEIIKKNSRGNRVLAIHYDTAEEKMPPIHEFKKAIDDFLNENDHLFSVFVVGVDDYNLHQISDCISFSCIGQNLATSMAIVSLADFFIGVDSCMLHLADAFNIPAIAFFGPTDRNEFGFRKSRCEYRAF